MASIYKRNNTYYIKFYEKSRRIRKSLGTSKRSEALRIKEQIERELAAGKFPLTEEDTDVDIFWKKYIEWARDHKRPRTIEIERLFWQQFTEYVKPRKLSDVSRRDVERFKAKRKKDGLKPQSINDALRHLQAIYNYARKLGYFSGDNPFVGIARYKLEKNPPRYLSREQIDTVLIISEQVGRDIHLVFAIGIFAGLRRLEIVNARWEWFDFRQKLITLSSHDGFFLKDSETRTIPLHDRLAEILIPYRQANGFVFMPDKEGQGKYRYRYEFMRTFNIVLESANLKWVTPHVLRHTFASQLAIAGVSLYKIANWLGHSDVKTTQVYAHLQTHDDDINKF